LTEARGLTRDVLFEISLIHPLQKQYSVKNLPPSFPLFLLFLSISRNLECMVMISFEREARRIRSLSATDFKSIAMKSLLNSLPEAGKVLDRKV
jgi:hypothetical protein